MNGNVWDNRYTPGPAMTNNVMQPQQANTFMFVNGRAMVDAWPMAANAQMTFIDPAAMKLWIKKSDQYGRPFNPEEYDLVRVEEETTPQQITQPKEPEIDMDKIREMVDEEVNKLVDQRVNERLQSMFTPMQPQIVPATQTTPATVLLNNQEAAR